MEGLAGFMGVLVLIWALAGIIFFLMVLSIAIDCARIVRRLNRIVGLLEHQPPPPRT